MSRRDCGICRVALECFDDVDLVPVDEGIGNIFGLFERCFDDSGSVIVCGDFGHTEIDGTCEV